MKSPHLSRHLLSVLTLSAGMGCARSLAPSASSATLPSAGRTSARGSTSANPFSAPSPLPFGAPQFDRITTADFEPAMEEGMRQRLAELNAIASQPGEPTFDNTIV